MKFQLFIFIIGLFNVISTDGRLIQKNKTRTVEEAQTEKPNPSIRLTRDIENDSLTGFSKESAQSEEFIKNYIKRARHFYMTPNTQSQKKTRIARDSMENRKDDTKTEKVTKTKPKAVLVKAPIPKFQEMDYDDFQSKMSNSHIIVDSGDHEDEDFNLEDYDFDINHDEFTSGRKPLEPRLSTKNVVAYNKKPDVKVISKLALPVSPKKNSTKKERSAELPSKTLDITKEFDYYDDTTTTKATENVTKVPDDEYDENDDSKEFNNKNNSVRNVRSWNVNLFGDKLNVRVSRFMTKFMDILPFFPQIHSYQIEENLDSSDEMAEPLTVTARLLY